MNKKLNEYIESLKISDKQKIKLYSLIGCKSNLDKRWKF